MFEKMRPSLSVALIACATLLAGFGTAHAVGPSFKCGPTNEPLARVICSDPELSRLDLVYVQSYQAFRQQVGDAGQAALRADANAHYLNTLQACGLPRSGQPAEPLANYVPCVTLQLAEQRNAWFARLSGPATEEAARPLDQHIAVQAALKQAAFLPQDAEIDGVYGPSTRLAIVNWQNAHNQNPTGFISGAQAALLLPGSSVDDAARDILKTLATEGTRPKLIPMSELARLPP